MADPSITAVVLAAGSATRFGGVKALASLEGMPLLQHVLDAVAAAGLTDVVVVLGAAADAIEPAIAWRTERRVRNEHPERGLASSLQVGLGALSGDGPKPPRGIPSGPGAGSDSSASSPSDSAPVDPSTAGRRAALIVLGDQPRLRPAVVARVIDAWRQGDRPIVVPRYAGSGALNPVLLDRTVWPLAMALEGDRGMGPFIKSSPDLVLDVPVSGDNPDVDTPADLAELTADR